MEDNTHIASMRYLNQSAIQKHALKCSQQLRAGLFKRVGQSFIDDVQAEAERIVREIRSKYQPPVHAVVPMEDGTRFVTGNFVELAGEVLNEVVPRIIQAKVQRHPSVGKTLMS
jgi:hypothetical protein